MKMFIIEAAQKLLDEAEAELRVQEAIVRGYKLGVQALFNSLTMKVEENGKKETGVSNDSPPTEGGEESTGENK